MPPQFSPSKVLQPWVVLSLHPPSTILLLLLFVFQDKVSV